ncbi:hypothetical protein [Phyllobacterium phragmitis]|nr:hypothetical protein [Phyllobacterium phragmitis]
MKGIKPGDRVVVEGFQRIAPDAPVKTTPWTNPALADANDSNRG